MAQIKAGANDFWEARALRRSFIHWHRTFDGMPRARTQGNPRPRSASPTLPRGAALRPVVRSRSAPARRPSSSQQEATNVRLRSSELLSY